MVEWGVRIVGAVAAQVLGDSWSRDAHLHDREASPKWTTTPWTLSRPGAITDRGEQQPYRQEGWSLKNMTHRKQRASTAWAMLGQSKGPV